MPRTVKCGLIQCTNAAPTDAPIEEIKRLNIEKHLGFIEQAAKQGVQIICMFCVFCGVNRLIQAHWGFDLLLECRMSTIRSKPRRFRRLWKHRGNIRFLL